MFIHNLREWLASDKPSTKSPVFSIDEVTLVNSQFSINDSTKEAISDGFDYYNFQLDSINLTAENFKVVADTLELNLMALTTTEPETGLTVKEMNTFYRLSKHKMQFLGLNLRANESVIRDTVVFNYASTEGLSYFNDSITFQANLDSTIIYAKDPGPFRPLHETLRGILSD